jgi:site-specific recombinase XerD
MRRKVTLEYFGTHLAAEGRSRDTMRAYTADIGRFVRAVATGSEEKTQAEEVRLRDIEAHLAELRERGLAPRTRHRAACAIRTFYSFLKSAGFIGANPAENLSAVSIPESLPTYLEPSEVAVFLKRCPDPFTKTLAAVLDHTGLRVGELCRLHLNDVDLGRGSIRVTLGKGAKDRVVPLNRWAKEFIVHYIMEMRPATGSDLLFITVRGAILSRAWAGELIRREGRRQRWVIRITPHTFRHSHATALYKAGVGLVTIAAILGHADISTTQIYTHVSSDQLLSAVEKLE